MSSAVVPWLKGLLAAVIAAAAQTITLIVVDPEKFNLNAQWKSTASAAAVGGIIAAAGYLKQSPLPSQTTPIPEVKS